MASSSDRFAFGANWARFLRRLTPERIRLTEQSLTDWLDDLRGRTFLDIGSGSGLYSLAARNLGARVRSFDYDPESVACSAELRRRFHPNDSDWVVEQGSALDETYLASLGTFDVVYSWGVLHHTGDLWRAMQLALLPVAPSGRFYLAIYNRLPRWRHYAVVAMKRAYVSVPPIRWPLLAAYAATHGLPEIGSAIYRRRPLLGYFHEYARTSRGMSWWTDVVDWVGGYPYESATAGEVLDFCRDRGFNLARQFTPSGHGCNEFLLSRIS
jgi:SAM-dependent methyltransferase